MTGQELVQLVVTSYFPLVVLLAVALLGFSLLRMI